MQRAIASVAVQACLVLMPWSAVRAAPLDEAAANGDTATVQALLGSGANINAADERGVTPLLAAIVADQHDMAVLLLSKGADPNLANKQGETPLLVASRQGYVEVVEMLLDKKSDVRAPSHDGVTPLLAATVAGERDVATLLIAADADVDGVQRVPGTLVDIPGLPTANRLPVLVTPLIVATAKNEREVAELLLDNGANVNGAAEAGLTPLLVAILTREQSLVELFVRKGADVNRGDQRSITPLLAAIDVGDEDLVKMLLSAGANVNAADRDGVTPLLSASDQSKPELAALLIARGANVSTAARADRSVPPIEVTGSNGRIIQASAAPASGRVQPLGIAIDPVHAKLYWTEYGADRIRRANLDGAHVETLAIPRLDGPIGIGINPGGGTLYWTTDASYPRKVQRAQLDGSTVEDLIAGRFVNRPVPVALDPAGGKVYWAESIAGRIRRANLDGTQVEEVVSSGLSSVQDVPGSEVTQALGVAVDAKAGRIYWTESTSAKIQRANLDGSNVEQILDSTDGLDVPAGLALDLAHGKMYWTDLGSEKIRRANLDGSKVEDLVTAAHGIVEPRDIALHVADGKMYWVDSTTEKIQRANLDGSGIGDVVSLGTSDGRPVISAAMFLGVDSACRNVIDEQGARFVRDATKAVATCLDKVGALKAVKRSASDAARASQTCIGQLRHLHDTRNPSRGLDAVFRNALERACASARTPAAGPGAHASRPVTDGGANCDGMGRQWTDCVLAAHDRRVREIIAMRYPRAREWVEEVRPFIAATSATAADGTRVGDALAALDGIYATLPARPRRNELSTASAGALPASGQTSTYAARRDKAEQAARVPDDGVMQAGEPMRYRDNRDGTVTDLVTGLMWEKKCANTGSLHDYRVGLGWSGDGRQRTIWDWLEELNRENGGGFAGHRDWRIPNIKELQSLIDYERFNPAVSRDFDGSDCGLGCANPVDPECSCTRMSGYWSATTFAREPERALVLTFNLGLVGDDAKTAVHSVRAVRDGKAPASRTEP